MRVENEKKKKKIVIDVRFILLRATLIYFEHSFKLKVYFFVLSCLSIIILEYQAFKRFFFSLYLASNKKLKKKKEEM